LLNKNSPTPRAPDKCGRSAALSGKRPQEAHSASGGFFRQFPRLPVTPAVGRTVANKTIEKWVCQFQVWNCRYRLWAFREPLNLDTQERGDRK